MYASTAVRDHEIDFGATLSPIALRHLFDHSAVHLNVEWRDLPGGRLAPQSPHHPGPGSAGHRNGLDAEPGSLDARRGPGQRRQLHRHPGPVLERLLKDITGAWKARGTDADLVVKVTDRGLTFGDTASAPGPWSPDRSRRRPMGRRPRQPRSGIRSTSETSAAEPASDADLPEVPAAPKWI